ncbi:MAG: hypothetical protein AAB617_01685 [Patescibacteria group bacterium]
MLDLSKLSFQSVEHHGMAVHALSSEMIRGNMMEIIPLVSEINSRAFGFSRTTPASETEQRLQSTDMLILAEAQNGVMGFASYQLIECNQTTVAYQSRGIDPKAQRAGLGRLFARIACQTLGPDVLAARAQNPASILATIRSGMLEQVMPVDRLYGDSTEMQKVLIDLVEARGFAGNVDLTTGLQKSAYPMGKLGDYRVDTDNSEIRRIEEVLISIGLDRMRGDTVYYMGCVI